MKNSLNNISQEEKNRILEMHSGKKNVITELRLKDDFLLNEGRISDIFSKIFNKFTDKQKEKLSNQLESEFGITSDSSKEEIEDKLRDKFGDVKDPSVFKKILRTMTTASDDFLSNFLRYSIEYAVWYKIIKIFDYNINAYFAAMVYWFITRFVKPYHQKSKFIRTQRDSDFEEKGPGLKGFDKDYQDDELNYH